MSRIFFTPAPHYVQQIHKGNFLPLGQLCQCAGVKCAASGSWTERKVDIKYGNLLRIEVEPGDWGAVRIVMKKSTKLAEARLALLVLAYSLHDLVAKQSIIGAPWARVPIPSGRIKTGMALSNSQRQKIFREKRN